MLTVSREGFYHDSYCRISAGEKLVERSAEFETRVVVDLKSLRFINYLRR